MPTRNITRDLLQAGALLLDQLTLFVVGAGLSYTARRSTLRASAIRIDGARRLIYYQIEVFGLPASDLAALGGGMRQAAIVAAAVIVSRAGAFGIAIGVQEWRGQTDSSLAILEIEALQEQTDAETCRIAILFSQEIRELTKGIDNESSRDFNVEGVATMFRACRKLDD